MAQETFAPTYGLGTAEVDFSFETDTTNPPVHIRDGKSSIVASVAFTNTGHYTVTFTRGLGRCVSGVVGCNVASPDDKFAANNTYTDAIPSTLEIRTYDISGAALANLADGDRISFHGVFSPRGDLRDAN